MNIPGSDRREACERLQVCSGDITRLAVDAIVNAANTSLLGGGGVDGAIHRGAGPQLLEYTRALGGCPVGEARLSPGFDLPAEWIIHTVGPVWRGGGEGEPGLLRQAYVNSLVLAREKALRRIAFPAISTGAYGYPLGEAARVAIEAGLEFGQDFDAIIYCCHTEADARVYRAVIEEYCQ